MASQGGVLLEESGLPVGIRQLNLRGLINFALFVIDSSSVAVNDVS